MAVPGLASQLRKLARQEGADITIAGRSQEKLAQAQRELGEVRTVAADITNEAAVGQVFEGISHVDHVVVAAGTIVNGRIVDNDLANLRRIIDERIWGVTYVVRHAAPRMTQGLDHVHLWRPVIPTTPWGSHAHGSTCGGRSPGASVSPGTGAGTRQCRNAWSH